MVATKSITFIAGPTASGKSKLALDLAKENSAAIINADSLQIYNTCPLLTAQPTAKDLETCPHKLYGYVPPTKHYNVGRWLEDVSGILNEDKSFIFVGGTGFYFHCLVHGLSPVPLVSPHIPKSTEKRYEEIGPQAFHDEVSLIDPEIAQRLPPQDKLRLIRAMSVWVATHKPLSYWQKQKPVPLIAPEAVKTYILLPEKDSLIARASDRFLQMIKQGVIEEVELLLKKHSFSELSPTLSKAIGLKPIYDFLSNQISYKTMLEQSILQTKQYIKRQLTWFRNQPLPHTTFINELIS